MERKEKKRKEKKRGVKLSGVLITNLPLVFFLGGGGELRSCQCAGLDLEGERRRPELG
jgi:hypothetical protein